MNGLKIKIKLPESQNAVIKTNKMVSELSMALNEPAKKNTIKKAAYSNAVTSSPRLARTMFMFSILMSSYYVLEQNRRESNPKDNLGLKLISNAYSAAQNALNHWKGNFAEDVWSKLDRLAFLVQENLNHDRDPVINTSFCLALIDDLLTRTTPNGKLCFTGRKRTLLVQLESDAVKVHQWLDRKLDKELCYFKAETCFKKLELLTDETLCR